MARVAEGFGRERGDRWSAAPASAGCIGTLRRASLLIGNDSGPRHLAAAVGTPTAAVFTYANLADVAPLSRTWHRLAVSWHGGCAVCGMRVLEGYCGHDATATADVPVEQVREMVGELWDQVVAAGRTDRDRDADGPRRPGRDCRLTGYARASCTCPVDLWSTP